MLRLEFLRLFSLTRSCTLYNPQWNNKRRLETGGPPWWIQYKKLDQWIDMLINPRKRSEHGWLYGKLSGDTQFLDTSMSLQIFSLPHSFLLKLYPPLLQSKYWNVQILAWGFKFCVCIPSKTCMISFSLTPENRATYVYPPTRTYKNIMR